MNKKGKLEMCWQQTRGQSCVDGDASRTRVLLCLDLGALEAQPPGRMKKLLASQDVERGR